MACTHLDSVAVQPASPASKTWQQTILSAGIGWWADGPDGSDPNEPPSPFPQRPRRPACAGPVLACGGWVYDALVRTDWQT